MDIKNTWIGDAAFARTLDEHPKQVGYAFRNAVNETAFKVQQRAQEIFSREFTERNTFTKRGIQFDRARSPILDEVEAVVGGKKNRPWLAKQHEGFTTDSAQATERMRVSGSYKRAVRKKQFLDKAVIRRRSDVQSKARTIRGKTAAMLAMSYREGFGIEGSNELIKLGKNELFSGAKEGLYQFVKGGEGKINLAYRINNQRKIKATPWLEMAIKEQGTPEQIWDRFEKDLKKQLEKYK